MCEICYWIEEVGEDMDFKLVAMPTKSDNIVIDSNKRFKVKYCGKCGRRLGKRASSDH